MLTISVMVEGEWWGTLGFDDCDREYEWSDVEIGLLRTAAFLIFKRGSQRQVERKTQTVCHFESIVGNQHLGIRFSNRPSLVFSGTGSDLSGSNRQPAPVLDGGDEISASL